MPTAAAGSTLRGERGKEELWVGGGAGGLLAGGRWSWLCAAGNGCSRSSGHRYSRQGKRIACRRSLPVVVATAKRV